jgi:hypothetical protein
MESMKGITERKGKNKVNDEDMKKNVSPFNFPELYLYC